MEEMLLAYAPAILVVVVALVLRVFWSRKKASEKIAALQKELAVLKLRNRQLEQERGQARERAFAAWLPGQGSALSEPPVFPLRLRELAPHSWPFTPSEKDIHEAFHRLQAIKALNHTVEEKYIDELDAIVERLEQATGMDLSRWLGVSPQGPQSGVTSPARKEVLSLGDHAHNRDLFRFKILSLLTFCNYQMLHSQPPPGSHPPASRAARRIH
jgi:hypothetical protein